MCPADIKIIFGENNLMIKRKNFLEPIKLTHFNIFTQKLVT